ncbi:MAG: hypothetical protein EZS28_017908 [Streblomastix strix]|uniref:Uncharacterized protein n=1 Tax=Streblomastix strix TaxID=222440 RepID=A0A5J4VWL5_9EUKA|nr:MAG: hypothetical protein EZS28_017908 [Streblomastix strix]
MARKYFLISEVRDIFNQFDVQYDPKSSKPVLEQLLLQTIKAQGHNRPKGSVNKIIEFVNNIITTNIDENNDTTNNYVFAEGNDEINEQNNNKEELRQQQLE